MNQELVKILFDINYNLPWSDDTELENTKIYKALLKQTNSLQPNPDYILRHAAFICALTILSVQLLDEDNHASVDANSVEPELEKQIDNLSNEDITILCNYFGLFYNLKIESINNNFFTTSNSDERIHYSTVYKCIRICLLREIEIFIEKLKVYLSKVISKDFWYELYDVSDSHEKERIDTIVKSILN